MTTRFDSHFAAAGFPSLLDNFGESILYVPYGGALRYVTAIVEREPPSVFDASGNAVFPKASIRVYNSTRSGIASSEVDIGKDEIEMYLKVGDTSVQRFSMLTLMAQDSGVTHLALI